MSDIDKLLEAAKILIERLNFDNSGVHGRGGNGGLISVETIRACDELRVIVNRVDRMRQ